MNRMFQNVLRQSLSRGNSTILSKQICATHRLFSDATAPPALGKEDLDKLVRTNKVVVFMKGNPEAPRCGFSNAVVQIMRMHGVQYDAHDVLKSEELRQGVKDYTDWPTIPQIFINGEFVGGCDILLQMHQSGDLIEELKKVGITSELLALAEAEKAAAKKEEKKK